MANNITPQRTQTPAGEADQEMVETKEEGIEEVPVIVEGGHVHILHTLGSLLKATGYTPPPTTTTFTFTASSFTIQRQTSLEYYSFLRLENPHFLKLNEGQKVYTALVSIPKSKLVKVVFCPGMGSNPICSAALPVDYKFLFLHGDGSDEIGPPPRFASPKTLVPLLRCTL